jgi:hypothetical protein
MLPTMKPYAVIAAAVAALGATVVGIPFAAAALRLNWTRWWQGVLVGAAASALSPGVGVLALGALGRTSGSIGEVLRTAAAAAIQPSPIMLAIGAATGLSYWSFAVARPRRWGGAAVAVVAVTGFVFLLLSEQAAKSSAQAREFELQRSMEAKLADSAELVSVRLTRVVALESSDAMFVGPSGPQCGLLIHSAPLVERIPIGAEVWADVTQFTSGAFAVVKLGDVTDRDQLARVELWRCKPWR